MKKKSNKRRDKKHALKIYFIAIFLSTLLLLIIYGVTNTQNISNDELQTNIKHYLQSQNNQTKFSKPQILKDENLSLNSDKNATPKHFDTNLSINLTPKLIKSDINDKNISEIFNAIDKNLLQNKDINLSQNNTSITQTKKIPKQLNKNPSAPLLKKVPKKPLLAIIIDDVGHFHQAKAIKQTGLKLTPSIFPVSKNNPHSAQIAKDFEVFMIHLPLSATHYKNEEPKTLHPNDSFDKIFARLKQIKADFPRLKFINNHTGSEFTSNFSASQNLIKAIKMQNLIFLDSKTTPKSAILAACKKHKFPYISRDIFLDNVLSQSAILSQLKQAISIAKRRGYAIAIGHPHDITLKTLSRSTILQEVEIVYIDRIYKEIYGNFN